MVSPKVLPAGRAIKRGRAVTYQQVSGCAGKVSYRSKAKAANAAGKMRRKKKIKVAEYKCQFCGLWHVGSNTETLEGKRWEPRKEADRPTRERRKRGEWIVGQLEKNGPKVAQDAASTPIDRMAHAGVISNDQASAARDFEDLYRRASETGSVRDSCTIWEPQGHDETDGPVEAVRDRRELYLFLGTQRDMLLRHVCVEHREPKRADQIGILREALNECCRFFKS